MYVTYHDPTALLSALCGTIMRLIGCPGGCTSYGVFHFSTLISFEQFHCQRQAIFFSLAHGPWSREARARGLLVRVLSVRTFHQQGTIHSRYVPNETIRPRGITQHLLCGCNAAFSAGFPGVKPPKLEARTSEFEKTKEILHISIAKMGG